MFNKVQAAIEISEGRYIKVRCPPAFQGVGWHSLILAFLAWGTVKNWDHAGVLSLSFAAVMALMIGALFYRNVFFRDEIILFKNAAEIEPNRFEFACADIGGIEVEPAPALMSYQWRMALAGLGRGLIVFRAGTQVRRFGLGLSQAQAQGVAKELWHFCESCKASDTEIAR